MPVLPGTRAPRASLHSRVNRRCRHRAAGARTTAFSAPSDFGGWEPLSRVFRHHFRHFSRGFLANPRRLGVF